ncbi:NAD(P)-binding protein [Paraphaeosphaeria sporulosa]|uniref:NAD(P)-binding protein n=1 Tax=Paraphaeosphaeria sporulosa TaxID=1460663 RepID=A0A177BUS1_9PLEO|nr:NAD(P)-binding protein [Paraphaeosphaeria sporulosa]OAF98471.1 NAD(P)-binding protein [Paraphaeosphaeria sporulosa]
MALLIDGVAIVTGAGSGIGRECCFAYASHGARAVVMADSNYSTALETAHQSNLLATHADYESLAIQVDVGDPESIAKMVTATVQRFGRIDYSVNSAGVGVRKPAPVDDVDLEEMNRFWKVNVLGTLNCIKAVSKVMKLQGIRKATTRGKERDVGRGVILNLGSCSSFMATAEMLPYTTSKHAVMGMTKNAALDLAKHGIRVNAICPSWVETPMVNAAVEGNPSLSSLMEASIPMARIAKVEEIADLVVLMTSPLASYVTGVGWIVDGGTTLQLKTS